MSLSLLYVTFPTETEARTITRELLNKPLIACANILGPMTSLYRWNGKIEESQEVAVIFKTTSPKVQELIDTLQTLHSYETPAIVEIPVGKSATSFCAWIQNEML